MSSRSFGEVGKTGGQRTAYRISQSEQLLPKPITIPALGREPQAGLLSSFELRSMSQPESGSRQILRWRKTDSNHQSRPWERRPWRGGSGSLSAMAWIFHMWTATSSQGDFQ